MSNWNWEVMDDGSIGQTLSDMADDTPIFQAAAADHNQKVLYPLHSFVVTYEPPRRTLWEWMFA